MTYEKNNENYVENDKYYMSKNLFIDIWSKYGNKTEIMDKKEIFDILNEIVECSEGQVNVDQFSGLNYSNICKITHYENYTLIYNKVFEDNREDFLNGNLSEFETCTWKSFYGASTYIYMLMDIRKIKLVKFKNHVAIILLSNLLPNKDIKPILINKDNELINQKIDRSELYTMYEFYEGDKSNFLKHECIVSNLPYYSCLIQPKIGSFSTQTSRNILLMNTINEIKERMDKVRKSLESIECYEYDELHAKGNTIRTILEYTLKYLCVYNDVDKLGKTEIETGYGKVELSKLRKKIKSIYPQIDISQKTILMANSLSHDSGVLHEKESVLGFWDKAMTIIIKVKDILEQEEVENIHMFQRGLYK